MKRETTCHAPKARRAATLLTAAHCAVFLIGVLVAAPALAQQGPTGPHLGYVYPAGGKQGETIDATVGGQTLFGANQAYVSGTGVTVTVGDYERPLNQKEFQDIRDKLTKAAKDLPRATVRGQVIRPRDPVFMGRLARQAGVSERELRGFLEFVRNRTDPKRQTNAQIAEKVLLQIKVEPGAEPGVRELRLLTAQGLSNPIRFVVGTLPEWREHEPNDDQPEPIGIGLPVVINGQIVPGDVDKFSFEAKKGANLVILAAARELTPYLADAVPGWFQATVAVLDAKGREVAFADHEMFRQDPAMYFTVPEDGKYTLVVRDAIFRGREDFVYRVTIGQIPHVTSIFPLGATVGATTTVSAIGWNLPNVSATVQSKQPRIVQVQVGQGKNASNGASFAVDMLPSVLEKEPNDDLAHAQFLNLPVVVNGRIARPGDVDVFKFKTKAGAKVVAETTARRLGSPLDSTLELLDSSGRRVAFNDEYDDEGAGPVTHQADSYLTATLASAGTYFLRVKDAQHKGGPAYAYRLRVSAPRPDFDLRVVPSSVTARAGMTVALTVYALRRDGFDGDVSLALQGAPEGYALGGGWVPGSTNKMRFTLTVPGSTGNAPVKIQLVGKATIQGREVVHPVHPAERQMQAFAYWHLVPVDDLLVAVIGRPNRGMRPRLPDGVVKVPSGGTVQVRVGMPTQLPLGKIVLSMNESPDGITVENVVSDATGFTFTVRADKSRAKPGLKGNLIVDLSIEREMPAAAGRQAVRRRAPLGTLPAIPFEVVR